MKIVTPAETPWESPNIEEYPNQHNDVFSFDFEGGDAETVEKVSQN